MLTLGINKGETIIIGEVRLNFVKPPGRSKWRVVIDAPKDMAIWREVNGEIQDASRGMDGLPEGGS